QLGGFGGQNWIHRDVCISGCHLRGGAMPLEMPRRRAMARMNGDRHSVAAFWVKGVAETLKAGGLDVPALLDEAGLDTAALSDPDARFPTERVSLLWQLAVARSGNPAIGLLTSNVVRPASFDVVAYTRRIRYSPRCMSGSPPNTSGGWTTP